MHARIQKRMVFRWAGVASFAMLSAVGCGNADQGSPEDQAEETSDITVSTVTLPGIVQAENFNKGGEQVGYYDTTPGNSGGQYRPNGDVDIEATTDTGGGYDVGWIAPTEWLAFSVDVSATGTYSATARVASDAAGTKSLHLEVDGSQVGSEISFTSAAGWQSWQNVTVSNLALTSGTHTLKIVFDTAGLNLNFVSFAKVATLGVKGGVGSTVDPAAYGTSSYITAADDFDTYVSAGLRTPIAPAINLEKWYFTDSSLPTSVPAEMADLAAKGTRFLISFKPSRTAMNSESSNALATTVAALKAGKINFSAVLYQEPNAHEAFASADAYHEYVAYYAPVMHAAGIPIVYDPALTGFSGGGDPVEYYPGDSITDAVYCDYYGTAYNQGTTLESLEALADNHKPSAIPFGLGEFGVSAVSNYSYVAADWNAYTNYIISFFTARLQAGKTNGDIIYYDSTGSGTLGNNGLSAGSPEIPQYQAIYNALSR